MDKIKLGISTCLLGEPVRYDGQHKLDPFLRDTLGTYVDYVPVCPEVEVGLGVPREAMHLEGDPASPRLVTIQTHIDHTDRMNAWARKRVEALEAEGLCGFIFKSRSPSSGMERVKVFNDKGVAVKSGVGLFAAAFMAHFPLLPVEEEGRLQDPCLRENFIERVFALQRWRAMLARGGPCATSSPSTPRTSTCCSRTARPTTGRWASSSPKAATFPQANAFRVTRRCCCRRWP